VAGGDYTSTFGYHGRLGRGQFWAGMTLVVAIGVVLVGVAGPLIGGTGDIPPSRILLIAALTLAFFLLLSLLMVRRLHDCGRSGWWFIPYGLLPFVLYAGPILLGRTLTPGLNTEDFVDPLLTGTQLTGIALFVAGLLESGFRRGTAGPNAYGPAPWGTHKSGT
jgi:uncharacterized membrane protein YhaH (DUF805 family)